MQLFNDVIGTKLTAYSITLPTRTLTGSRSITDLYTVTGKRFAKPIIRRCIELGNVEYDTT